MPTHSKQLAYRPLATCPYKDNNCQPHFSKCISFCLSHDTGGKRYTSDNDTSPEVAVRQLQNRGASEENRSIRKLPKTNLSNPLASTSPKAAVSTRVYLSAMTNAQTKHSVYTTPTIRFHCSSLHPHPQQKARGDGMKKGAEMLETCWSCFRSTDYCTKTQRYS